MTIYSAGYKVIRDLRYTARRIGAGDAELAAIDRLENGKAQLVDIYRLEPLAESACIVEWQELFPEIYLDR